jgi:hypothetical protein
VDLLAVAEQFDVEIRHRRIRLPDLLLVHRATIRAPAPRQGDQWCPHPVTEALGQTRESAANRAVGNVARGLETVVTAAGGAC